MLRTHCPAGQDICFTLFIDIDAEPQVAKWKSDTLARISSSSLRLNPLIETKLLTLNHSIKTRSPTPRETRTLSDRPRLFPFNLKKKRNQKSNH